MKEIQELVDKLPKQMIDLHQIIATIDRKKQDGRRQMEERWTARPNEI